MTSCAKCGEQATKTVTIAGETSSSEFRACEVHAGETQAAYGPEACTVVDFYEPEVAAFQIPQPEPEVFAEPVSPEPTYEEPPPEPEA